MKNSKHAKVFVMTLVTLLMVEVSFSLFAHQTAMRNETTCAPQDFYINPSMIFLASNGMFVNCEGKCFSVNTLCSDSHGLFIPSHEMSRQLQWCPICQQWRDPHHLCTER